MTQCRGACVFTIIGFMEEVQELRQRAADLAQERDDLIDELAAKREADTSNRRQGCWFGREDI